MISKNARQTKKIAAALAKKFLKSRLGKHAKVIALVGELGSGKTTFTQGFIKALGSKEKVVSPTFLIFRPYALKSKKYRKVYHVDLYRIHSVKDLAGLGFKKILSDPKNILLIEWADRIKRQLPKNTLWVYFEHGEKENIRKTEIISE